MNRAIQSPEVREQLNASVFDAAGGTPQQFSNYLRAEIVKWGKVVKETGARPD